MLEGKVAYISNTNLRTIGGAQESIKNLFSFKDPCLNGTNSVWINISPYDLPSDVVVSDSVITKEAFKIPFSAHRIPTPKEVLKVRSYLETSNPSTIILNHPDFYSSSLFLALPKELRERTYAIWRGIVGMDSYYIEYTNPAKKIMRKVLWTGLEKVQRIVGNNVKMNFALSEATARSLVKIGIASEKVGIIPAQIGGEYNPVLRKNYGEGFRQQFLAPDELGVLVVGRISPEKGMGWVLDLYEILRQELRYKSPDALFRRVRLSIAGNAIERSNGYLKHLKQRKKLIDDNTCNIFNANGVKLEFIGSKRREELQQLYNAYDVLFMPSPTEGFGRVTVEALSAGMPVIGRKGCGAIEEIINQPPYAVGTIVQSPEAATAEIFYLMNEPATLLQLQLNASQWATNHYTLEHAEKEFWKAIRR